ncbi:MAG: hypothetical protein Q9222_000969 [Ikaeria aurantiellina]
MEKPGQSGSDIVHLNGEPDPVPQKSEDAQDIAKEVQHDDSPREAENSNAELSEGKTFVLDPNILAPWDEGYADGPEDEDAAVDGQTAELVDQDNGGGAVNGEPTVAGKQTEVTLGVAKKTKSKKKPKSKRGLKAPTGFEEFYVDAPVTPAEHEEERGLYDRDIAFDQRIEVAIQRFCARRNMDSSRKDVFDKYLSLGGISAGPKMFSGGLDSKDLSDKNAADIALMKATHFVDIHKYAPENAYEVDFETCAKAFFSSRMPQIYDLTSVDSAKSVQSKTNVVRNFLNYLSHHDVCPEYQSQILAARAICDLADKELPRTMRAQAYFPGDFQVACSEIFGGVFHGTYARHPGWADDLESFAGMSPDVARQTFKIGLATQASDEVAGRYKEQSNALDIKTLKVQEVGLEVTELLPATPAIKKFYDHHPAAKGLKSLGRMKAKTWNAPFMVPQDLTEEERIAEAKSSKAKETYEFLMEDYVLETCFVGMKFQATVRELSFGLKFFDTVSAVSCSFFEVLPNQLLIGWRAPEDEPLPAREKSIVRTAIAESLGVEEEEVEGGFGLTNGAGSDKNEDEEA